MVCDQSDIYLDELQQYLFELIGRWLDCSTIHRILTRDLGITRKVCVLRRQIGSPLRFCDFDIFPFYR